MLRGALDKASADIGIAVSGVAGLVCGTDEKPVGTVWLAGARDKMMRFDYKYPIA